MPRPICKCNVTPTVGCPCAWWGCPTLRFTFELLTITGGFQPPALIPGQIFVDIPFDAVDEKYVLRIPDPSPAQPLNPPVAELDPATPELWANPYAGPPDFASYLGGFQTAELFCHHPTSGSRFAYEHYQFYGGTAVTHYSRVRVGNTLTDAAVCGGTVSAAQVDGLQRNAISLPPLEHDITFTASWACFP